MSLRKRGVVSVLGIGFFCLLMAGSVLAQAPQPAKAATAIAQAFNFEAVKAKGEAHKPETIVFKGFYIGMPVGDAQALINHYMGFPQASASPVVNTNSAADPASAALGAALLGAFSQMGMSSEGDKASYRVYAKSGEKVVARDAYGRAFAVANKEGKIVSFELSKTVCNKLFGSEEMPKDEFLQTFVNAYDIPEMESEVRKLTMGIMGITQEVGIQNVLLYRSPKGFEVVYYDAALFTEDGAEALCTTPPEGTLTIKKIETAENRESKFD